MIARLTVSFTHALVQVSAVQNSLQLRFAGSCGRYTTMYIIIVIIIIIISRGKVKTIVYKHMRQRHRGRRGPDLPHLTCRGLSVCWTPAIIPTVTVTVTELHSSTTFSEESCSVGLSEKMGFQLRSELLATVVR